MVLFFSMQHYSDNTKTILWEQEEKPEKIVYKK